MPQSNSMSNRQTSSHSRAGNTQSHAKRSDAAKKGWITRRKNAIKRG
jgi:hypothetical protein